MLWQYRTIIFEFAKDGLLGDKYINDEEMENTLNEQGLMGWEVVSVVGVQEGILALLKRSVSKETQQPDPSVRGRAEKEDGQIETGKQHTPNPEREHLAALIKDDQAQPSSESSKPSTSHVGDIKIF